jgi:dGTPase
MNWSRLLTPQRLGRDPALVSGNRPQHVFLDVRSEFVRDWDRLVFSSAFRRLQDKTQVVAGRRPDHVRTRLTHSLEVASVARSLGTGLGRWLVAQGQLDAERRPEDLGAVLAAAALMHDIGNPPFGHAGERVIQAWFASAGAPWLSRLDAADQADFLQFEGNAQGLRVVLSLQHPGNRGGLQLTLPTLGAFAKYPRVARVSATSATGASGRKHGIMRSELALFEEAAESLGLLRKSDADAAWYRHPLAFLLEAADDICYGVVDIEDGLKSGRIAYEELRALHVPFLTPADLARADSLADVDERARMLRASTIHELVRHAFEAMVQRHDALLTGCFDQPLTEVFEGAEAFTRFRQLARERLYGASDPEGTPSASQVLPVLLEAGCAALSPRAWEVNPAAALRQVTDHVSGMTDGYAIDVYRDIVS